MVGQPLYPPLDEEEDVDYQESEPSGTIESSQYRLNPTPGPVLQKVVDYFHEGDKVLDKKGSKK